MKKIPHGSKVVNIMIGELEILDKIAGAFVRLKVMLTFLFKICLIISCQIVVLMYPKT